LDAVVLARNFPFVAAAGQSVVGDWIGFDSEFQDANVHVHCQTISPTGLTTGFTVITEASYDTAEEVQVGSAINVNAPGSTDSSITAGLADRMRVKITNGELVTVMAIVSVWLQPKNM
jgi:hypothetical protein